MQDLLQTVRITFTQGFLAGTDQDFEFQSFFLGANGVQFLDPLGQAIQSEGHGFKFQFASLDL